MRWTVPVEGGAASSGPAGPQWLVSDLPVAAPLPAGCQCLLDHPTHFSSSSTHLVISKKRKYEILI